jgi:hypothetical protein
MYSAQEEYYRWVKVRGIKQANYWLNQRIENAQMALERIKSLKSQNDATR